MNFSAIVFALISMLSLASPSDAKTFACRIAFGEVRTARPVSKFTLIVPVYRELKNGNVARFLETLSSQQLRTHQIEVVMVVNNTTEIARDKDSPIRRENQETITYLREAVHRNKYPFSLEVIDLSTQGTERNMGKIRQTGVEAVIRKSNIPLDQNVVIHMDMDTRFEGRFFANLEKLYIGPKNPDVVFFSRRYELRGTPSTALLASHPSYKRERIWRDFKILLSSLDEGVATYQISSRASALVAIGGFKPLERGEDTQLSRDLIQLPTVLAPDVTVSTEDRSRPDGFTGALRSESLAGGGTKKKLFPVALLMTPILESLSRRVENQKTTLDFAVAEFEAHARELLAISQFASESSLPTLREALAPTLYTPAANPGKTVFDYVTRDLPPHEKQMFSNIVERLSNENRLASEARLAHIHALATEIHGRPGPNGDPFMNWARWENPEFRELLETSGVNHRNPRALKKLLTEKFPDWLDPLAGHSISRDTIYLRAAYEGLVQVHHEPTLAPRTSERLLKWMAKGKPRA